MSSPSSRRAASAYEHLARFAPGTDYGADPMLGPPDFHAEHGDELT